MDRGSRIVNGRGKGPPQGVPLQLECGRARLPLFVDYVVLGVDGEDVGFVDVVGGSVGVEGADAELVFGGQVVDGDGFAGAGIEAGVEGDGIALIGMGEDAEFVEERADGTGTVVGDEVDAQAVPARLSWMGAAGQSTMTLDAQLGSIQQALCGLSPSFQNVRMFLQSIAFPLC